MLKGDAFWQVVMGRLEKGRHPMMAFTVCLWMRNPTTCSCLTSLPLKKSLWPSGVDISPKIFQHTSQSPRMFHRYLLILCVSSSTFSAALSDFSFQCLSWCCFWHVVILVHQSHTFHLCPDGQQRKARSLFQVMTEPVWIELWLSSSCGVSWAMLHGRAHPSPCQTIANVLHLHCLSWFCTHSRWVPEGTLSALASNLHGAGHLLNDAVLTSPPHVV